MLTSMLFLLDNLHHLRLGHSTWLMVALSGKVNLKIFPDPDDFASVFENPFFIFLPHFFNLFNIQYRITFSTESKSSGSEVRPINKIELRLTDLQCFFIYSTKGYIVFFTRFPKPLMSPIVSMFENQFYLWHFVLF